MKHTREEILVYAVSHRDEKGSSWLCISTYLRLTRHTFEDLKRILLSLCKNIKQKKNSMIDDHQSSGRQVMNVERLQRLLSGC